MTVFDYVVLAVLAASVLLGFSRGVVSEILGLVAWVVAFFVARAQASWGAQWLVERIADPSLRLAVAFGVILVGVLVLFSIVRLVLSLLLKAIGLGLLDRLLGACFGVLRGGIVVLAGVAVAGMTALPKAVWWREAMLSPPLETAVIAAKPWLPAEVAKRIRFR